METQHVLHRCMLYLNYLETKTITADIVRAALRHHTVPVRPTEVFIRNCVPKDIRFSREAVRLIQGWALQ